MALNEGPLLVDDLVGAEVSMEVGLNALEKSDRTVGSAATVQTSICRSTGTITIDNEPELATGSNGRGNADGVVEGQTQ